MCMGWVDAAYFRNPYAAASCKAVVEVDHHCSCPGRLFVCLNILYALVVRFLLKKVWGDFFLLPPGGGNRWKTNRPKGKGIGFKSDLPQKQWKVTLPVS